MRIWRYLVAGILLGTSISAQALRPEEMTPAERKALPAWCEFTHSFDRTPGAPGHFNDHVARYGVGWTHVHHFCWALGSLMRYSRYDTTAQMKQSLVAAALDDIDYVLRNAPRDFVLRYEILVRKVRVLVMHGALADAEALSREVLAEWPDRADSHGLVAEVLLASGRRREASDVLAAADAAVRDRARLKQIRGALKL